MRRVYLDHAATTPLDPQVFEAMVPYLKEFYGNASSLHAMGRKARFAVEESRETVADLLGAEPGEIVFTSGGTESNNTAIKGGTKKSGGAVLTSSAEHAAVLRPAERMREDGRRLVLVEPGNSGAPEPSAIAERLDDGEIGFVSLIHGNNELGTLTDIATIASFCRERGVMFHTDAVQTAGYGLLRVDEAGVDLASLSAHKMYGPKGVGALYVRGGVDVEPLLEGGAQERRRRGGTENVAAIVGMARALALSIESAPGRRKHAAAMRDRLHRGLVDLMGPRMVVNTPIKEAPAMPHVLNVAFPPFNGEPLDGEMLLLNLDVEGVLASAGSACTSGALEPSHVLTAIGLDPATASAGVRFSVGKDTSEDDVDYAVDVVDRVIRRMTREKVDA